MPRPEFIQKMELFHGDSSLASACLLFSGRLRQFRWERKRYRWVKSEYRDGIDARWLILRG